MVYNDKDEDHYQDKALRIISNTNLIQRSVEEKLWAGILAALL
jgi:hypothetical protein